MHIRCSFKDDTREQVEFSIIADNVKEENEINLFWSLLRKKKMEDISKFIENNMIGLKFVFNHAKID